MSVDVAAERRGYVYASDTGSSADWLATQALAESGGISPYFIGGSSSETPQLQHLESSGGWRIQQAQWRFDAASSGVLGTISKIELRIWSNSGGTAPSNVAVVGAATWANTANPTLWENPTTLEEYTRFAITASSALYTVDLGQAAVSAFTQALDSGDKFALSFNDGATVDSTALADNRSSQAIASSVAPRLIIYTEGAALSLGINI